MERLTEKHVKKNGGYYMKCSEYCEREETMCFECERSDEIVDRLGVIEDILGDDYDLDRLRELLEACKGLEPSEIAESKLLIATRKDPEKLARMAELVEADRDGRCFISPKLVCMDEITTPTPEQYRWMMGRFLKGGQDE